MSSYQYRDPMLKIRRSRDRLIFNMGILYLERRSLYWDGARVIVGQYWAWVYPTSGPLFHIKTVQSDVGDSVLSIRPSHDFLICLILISMPGKTMSLYWNATRCWRSKIECFLPWGNLFMKSMLHIDRNCEIIFQYFWKFFSTRMGVYN